jgi:hypothetical protein
VQTVPPASYGDTTTRRAFRRGPADMRPCRRCGHTDPFRMHALMTLWYGGLADMPPRHGYFYLCPACYEACIVPHLDEIQHGERHPPGHPAHPHHHDHHDPRDHEGPQTGRQLPDPAR